MAEWRSLALKHSVTELAEVAGRDLSIEISGMTEVAIQRIVALPMMARP
jgi:post-segregation antitoxin (ccd killing protein)